MTTIDNNEFNELETVLNLPDKQHQSLAMAYVPYQEFDELYDTSQALWQGTLFKGLSFPFLGRRLSEKS